MSTNEQSPLTEHKKGGGGATTYDIGNPG